MTEAFDRETTIVKLHYRRQSKELIDQKIEIRRKIEDIIGEIDKDYDVFGSSSRPAFIDKSFQIISKCDKIMSEPVPEYEYKNVTFKR